MFGSASSSPTYLWTPAPCFPYDLWLMPDYQWVVVSMVFCVLSLLPIPCGCGPLCLISVCASGFIMKARLGNRLGGIMSREWSCTHVLLAAFHVCRSEFRLWVCLCLCVWVLHACLRQSCTLSHFGLVDLGNSLPMSGRKWSPHEWS